MWGHTGAPMLHVGISYYFEKKRLFIVDYIKPSPVYQVKCKLVFMFVCVTLSTTNLRNKPRTELNMLDKVLGVLLM